VAILAAGAAALTFAPSTVVATAGGLGTAAASVVALTTRTLVARDLIW